MKEKYYYVTAFVFTFLFYIFAELMFRFMPNASLFAPLVYGSEIDFKTAFFIMLGTGLTLVFAVDSWIELYKFAKKKAEAEVLS